MLYLQTWFWVQILQILNVVTLDKFSYQTFCIVVSSSLKGKNKVVIPNNYKPCNIDLPPWFTNQCYIHIIFFLHCFITFSILA